MAPYVERAISCYMEHSVITPSIHQKRDINLVWKAEQIKSPLFHRKSKILKDLKTHNSSLLFCYSHPDTKHKSNVNFVRNFFPTKNWLLSLWSLNSSTITRKIVHWIWKKAERVFIESPLEFFDHQTVNRVLWPFCPIRHLTHRKKIYLV